MSVHNGLGDIQAESDPSSIVLVQLKESHKHGFQPVGRNARSGVADRELNVIADTFTWTTTSPPAGVNLIALLRRFANT